MCVVAITLMATAVAACGHSAPASPSSTTASAASPLTLSIPSGIGGCEVTGSTPATPLLSDPKGPYFDQLGLASTADGGTARDYREVLPHASAPDGTLLPDGSVGVYYNNGETGGSVWTAASRAWASDPSRRSP